MPSLRRPLRQGRLPGRLPREELSVRLLVQGVGAHVRRLHAEGVRGRDRPRHADGGRAQAGRFRRHPGGATAAPDVQGGGRTPPTRPAARTPGASTRSSASCPSAAPPSACSLSRERARRAAGPRAAGESPAPRARPRAPSSAARDGEREHVDGRRCRPSAGRRPGCAAARGRARDGRRGRSRDPEADRRLLRRADGRGTGDLALPDLGHQRVDVPLRRRPSRGGRARPRVAPSAGAGAGSSSPPAPADPAPRRRPTRSCRARDSRLTAAWTRVTGTRSTQARRARLRAGLDLHRRQVAAERVRDRERRARGGRHRTRARHPQLERGRVALEALRAGSGHPVRARPSPVRRVRRELRAEPWVASAPTASGARATEGTAGCWWRVPGSRTAAAAAAAASGAATTSARRQVSRLAGRRAGGSAAAARARMRSRSSAGATGGAPRSSASRSGRDTECLLELRQRPVQARRAVRRRDAEHARGRGRVEVEHDPQRDHLALARAQAPERRLELG